MTRTTSKPVEVIRFERRNDGWYVAICDVPEDEIAVSDEAGPHSMDMALAKMCAYCAQKGYDR